MLILEMQGRGVNAPVVEPVASIDPSSLTPSERDP
jgi:hypothetical protein